MKSYVFFIITMVFCLSWQNASAVIGISYVKNCSTQTNSDGEIEVSASGNAGPFTYYWGPGLTTNKRTNLPVGTYKVTVTNSFGCTFVREAQIKACSPQPPIYEPIKISDYQVTALSAIGTSDGGVDITPGGGYAGQLPTLYYKWVNTATGVVVSTSQDVSGLPTGTYTVTVTDGCTTATGTYKIIACQGIVWSVNGTLKKDCNCDGCTFCSTCIDGSIQLTVAGGVSPYRYKWSNAPSNNSSYNGSLAAGTYTVTITDKGSGCSTTKSFTIDPVDVVVAKTNGCAWDATCDAELVLHHAGVTEKIITISADGKTCLSTQFCEGEAVAGATDLPTGDTPIKVGPTATNCKGFIKCGIETVSTILGTTSTQDGLCGGQITTCKVTFPDGSVLSSVINSTDGVSSVSLDGVNCKATITCGQTITTINGTTTEENLYASCGKEKVCRITLPNGDVKQYNTPISGNKFVCRGSMLQGENGPGSIVNIGCNLYCTDGTINYPFLNEFIELWGDESDESISACASGNNDLFPSCTQVYASQSNDRAADQPQAMEEVVATFDIVPNPTSKSFAIKNLQTGAKGERIRVCVYDVFGVVAYDKVFDGEGADQTIQVTLEDYIPSGTYWVSVACGACPAQKKKVMLQKAK